MTELTPIPAEHRKVYYDALLAGRAEAERLGYGLLDDRIFGEFWAAIRSAYTPLIEAATRRQVAEEIAPLLAETRVCLSSGCDCDYVLGTDGCTGTRNCWTPTAWSLNPDDVRAAIARGRGETDTKEQK